MNLTKKCRPIVLQGEYNFYSKSETETEALGKKLARLVGYGTIISLTGNLGTGKTIFTKGFAKGLGINEIIASPTFNIIREYSIGNDKWLYHMDLYRIQDINSALAFGIDEYINDSNAVSIIEWAECLERILPSKTIYVTIRRLSDTQREIVIVSDMQDIQFLYD